MCPRILIRGNASAKCTKAGTGSFFQLFKSLHDDNAIFIDHRHHIGYGADHGKVGVCAVYIHNRFPRRNLFSAAHGLNRCHQLEGHTNTRKVGKGVSAIRTMGIHHCHRIGQDLTAGVMVGDHNIHAEEGGIRHLVDGGNAVIDGNDQLSSVFMQCLDGLLDIPYPSPKRSGI